MTKGSQQRTSIKANNVKAKVRKEPMSLEAGEKLKTMATQNPIH